MVVKTKRHLSNQGHSYLIKTRTHTIPAFSGQNTPNLSSKTNNSYENLKKLGSSAAQQLPRFVDNGRQKSPKGGTYKKHKHSWPACDLYLTSFYLFFLFSLQKFQNTLLPFPSLFLFPPCHLVGPNGHPPSRRSVCGSHRRNLRLRLRSPPDGRQLLPRRPLRGLPRDCQALQLVRAQAQRLMTSLKPAGARKT